MTRDELLAKLREVVVEHGDDPEVAHIEAEHLLLEFIGDDEIADAFGDVPKWYS